MNKKNQTLKETFAKALQNYKKKALKMPKYYVTKYLVLMQTM